jgi:hypothetical protein
MSEYPPAAILPQPAITEEYLLQAVLAVVPSRFTI